MNLDKLAYRLNSDDKADPNSLKESNLSKIKRVLVGKLGIELFEMLLTEEWKLDRAYWSMFLMISEKVVPQPFCESTYMSPPKALDKFLLIDKPSPTPYLLSSLSSWIFVKTEKRVFSLSLLIPTPVSCTWIHTPDVSVSFLMAILMKPLIVYLTALESKLMIICRNLF